MHEIIVFRLVTQIVVEYTWKKTLDKTEAAIKNTQSRETGNIEYQRHKNKDKQKKNRNTICVGHHYAQTNSNNVKKT